MSDHDPREVETPVADAGEAAPPDTRVPRWRARTAPRPWLAAMLAFSPGIGHVYAWRLRRAIAWWVAMAASAALAFGVMLFAPAPLMPLGLVLFVALIAATVVDAWRTARRVTADERPVRWQVWLWVIAAAIASAEISEWLKQVGNAHAVEAFRIASGSMEPTVLAGDYVLVARSRPRLPTRDALIVHRLDSISVLKRIAGIAGDTLAMAGGHLVRNGETVLEPYAQLDSTHDPWPREVQWMARRSLLVMTHATTTRYNWGPLVVPPDSVFVLADNRPRSADSRHFGFVAVSDLTGRPVRVYFSRDPEAGIRWGRIGHWIR